MNEQHSLMKQQEVVLREQLGDFEFLHVPAAGWTLEQQKEVAQEVLNMGKVNVVFASPVPLLLASLSFASGYGKAGNDTGQAFVGDNVTVFVLHNDVREKKELPNGKVVFTVAKEGWQLVKVE
jgi:hypothetical protein